MKISVFIATSLDGFIARVNGDIDWLVNTPMITQTTGTEAFIATVDCLVIGRNTFEKVQSFPEWPHAGKRVVVISRTLKQDSRNILLAKSSFPPVRSNSWQHI